MGDVKIEPTTSMQLVKWKKSKRKEIWGVGIEPTTSRLKGRMGELNRKIKWGGGGSIPQSHCLHIAKADF